MKILIIARGYPTEKYPLNGVFEFDQAKALINSGHEVIFLALDMRSLRRWRKWGHDSFIKENIQVESLSIPIGRLPVFLVNKMREYYLKKIFRIVEFKYGKPEIIHSHFLITGFVTLNALGHTNIPIVLTEHFSKVNQDHLPEYIKKLGINTYSRVNQLITVSNFLSEKIEKNFGVQSIVIPNCFDTSVFSYNQSIEKSDFFTFISVGRLVKNKGFDVLIKAFNDAFSHKSKVELFIYGDGPEKETLSKMIVDYSLTEKVFLMGQVDRKLLVIKMRTSHCFVLASKRETFGVAFIEAMATGLPVITTKSGGPEEFVNSSIGIIVEDHTYESLSQAMKDMYININRYDNLAISTYVNENFSTCAIVEKLNRVYFSFKE